MRWLTLVTSATVMLSGCGGSPQAKRQPVTERQRDSVIGASRIPGSQGVGRALQASDSGTARRALEDSLAREQ